MTPSKRQDLTRKIQSLSDLTPDEKSALLELLNTRKKYGLVWEDKPEKVEGDLRTQFPVLTEVADRRIVGPDGSPNHVLIEGDNLHALTALQYTHERKIDVIFIDPPYNTGNKDFVYNDHFVDKEDQWRHSKWLSFMEKRLKLAKSLLKETGVIFITIDDNEYAQLKLICDEIFGANGFLSSVVWQHSLQSKGYPGSVSLHHNHILIFQVSSGFTLGQLDRTDEHNRNYSNPDKDPRGDWRPGDVRNALVRKNLMYDIEAPNGNIISHPPNGWRFSRETFERELSEGKIIFSKDQDRIIRKIYLADQDGRVPESIWFGKEVGTTRDGTQILKDIFGERNLFDSPKPVELLRRIISIGGDRQSTILDFFAGSGTTLHATMALNAEDGGSRQCILVTNNENNICEEVTYERNRRVIQGYTNAKGVEVPGLTANSLRYYKTAFVSRERSQKNRRDLTRASVDLLCLKDNSYAERSELKSADRRVFEGLAHLLFIVFDPDAIPETVELIASAAKPSKVYVFSPGAYAWDDDFEEVKDKITLCALPEALIQAFQKVMPAEGREDIYTEEPEAQE